MHLLDLTLDTPAENLALDEALLERAEAAAAPWQALRFWSPVAPCVVVGRSSCLAEEVRLAECRRRGVPVLRRSSGGAAIVAGPGCLMYALVLSVETDASLRSVDAAHRRVLAAMSRAIGRLASDVACQGISDLVQGVRKFSGNSVRLRRRALLYHGTLLVDFDLALISACLHDPPRQPEYRAGRSHVEFVTNLAVDPGRLKQAIAEAWSAETPLVDWPHDATARLAAEKYSQSWWNEQR